jgi:hypothetical protein
MGRVENKKSRGLCRLRSGSCSVEDMLGDPPPYGEVGLLLGKEKWTWLHDFARTTRKRGFLTYWEMQRGGMMVSFPEEMKLISALYDDGFYDGAPSRGGITPGVRGERKTRCSLFPCATLEAAANMALATLERGSHVVHLSCYEGGRAFLKRLQQGDHGCYKHALLDEDHYVRKKTNREARDEERPSRPSPPVTTFQTLAEVARGLGVAEEVIKTAVEAAAEAEKGSSLRPSRSSDGAEDSNFESQLGGDTLSADSVAARIDPFKMAMEAAYKDHSRRRPRDHILSVAQANHDRGVYEHPLRVTQHLYLQLRTDESSSLSHSRTLLAAAGGVGKSWLMVMEILKALIDADKRGDGKPVLVCVITHRRKLVVQLLKDLALGLYDQEVRVVYRDDEDADALKGARKLSKATVAAAVGGGGSALSPGDLGGRGSAVLPAAGLQRSDGLDIEEFILETFDEVRAFTATPQAGEDSRGYHRFYDRFGILTVAPRVCALLGETCSALPRVLLANKETVLGFLGSPLVEKLILLHPSMGGVDKRTEKPSQDRSEEVRRSVSSYLESLEDRSQRFSSSDIAKELKCAADASGSDDGSYQKAYRCSNFADLVQKVSQVLNYMEAKEGRVTPIDGEMKRGVVAGKEEGKRKRKLQLLLERLEIGELDPHWLAVEAALCLVDCMQTQRVYDRAYQRRRCAGESGRGSGEELCFVDSVCGNCPDNMVAEYMGKVCQKLGNTSEGVAALNRLSQSLHGEDYHILGVADGPHGEAPRTVNAAWTQRRDPKGEAARNVWAAVAAHEKLGMDKGKIHAVFSTKLIEIGTDWKSLKAVGFFGFKGVGEATQMSFLCRLLQLIFRAARAFATKPEEDGTIYYKKHHAYIMSFNRDLAPVEATEVAAFARRGDLTKGQKRTRERQALAGEAMAKALRLTTLEGAAPSARERGSTSAGCALSFVPPEPQRPAAGHNKLEDCATIDFCRDKVVAIVTENSDLGGVPTQDVVYGSSSLPPAAQLALLQGAPGSTAIVLYREKCPRQRVREYYTVIAPSAGARRGHDWNATGPRPCLLSTGPPTIPLSWRARCKTDSTSVCLVADAVLGSTDGQRCHVADLRRVAPRQRLGLRRRGVLSSSPQEQFVNFVTQFDRRRRPSAAGGASSNLRQTGRNYCKAVEDLLAQRQLGSFTRSPDLAAAAKEHVSSASGSSSAAPLSGDAPNYLCSALSVFCEWCDSMEDDDDDEIDDDAVLAVRAKFIARLSTVKKNNGKALKAKKKEEHWIDVSSFSRQHLTAPPRWTLEYAETLEEVWKEKRRSENKCKGRLAAMGYFFRFVREDFEGPEAKRQRIEDDDIQDDDNGCQAQRPTTQAEEESFPLVDYLEYLEKANKGRSAKVYRGALLSALTSEGAGEVKKFIGRPLSDSCHSEDRKNENEVRLFPGRMRALSAALPPRKDAHLTAFNSTYRSLQTTMKTQLERFLSSRT